MKKRIKYFILPIVIFSIFAFVDFPKSHAKYIKEEIDKVKYSTNVKKLALSGYNSGSEYIGFTTQSTYQNAIFSVYIPRNNVMYDSDILDTYDITINNTQNSCYIVDGSTTGTGNADVDEHDSHSTISYDTVNGGELMNLKVSCTVIDNPVIGDEYEYLYLDFTVKEQITNTNGISEEEFTYFEYQANVALSDYYRGDRKPPSDETALYTNAIAAIENNYSNLGDTYLGYIKDYFRSVFYAGIENDEFIANKDNLVGFSYDEATGYSFDDNFAGYAITWKLYEQSTDKSAYRFYFSTSDSDDRKTVFDYYLNTYSTDELKAYGTDKIKDYINLYNGGLDAAFEGKVYRVLTETNTTLGISNLNFNDNIMTMIDNRYSTSYKKIVNNRDVGPQPYDTFMIAVYSYYESNITDNMFNDMYGDTSLQESALRNFNNTSGYSKFSDFYFYSDSNKHILFTVFSDTDGDYDASEETYTYYQLFTLNSGELITLSVPTGSTTNMTVFDVINQIDELVNPGSYTPITSFGTSYNTYTDTNNIVHNMYEVDSVTYDIYTIDDIEYITYMIR